MKKLYLTAILSLLCVICHAQYPAPSNFYMGYTYASLDKSIVCNGIFITGPAYCWRLRWETPDLSMTEAQLTGYNVYYYSANYYIEGMEIPVSETILIGHTTENYIEGELCIQKGIVWVTASYSEPEGESGASNIVFFDGVLPIGIEEVKEDVIVFVDIINLYGITVKSFTAVNFSDKDIADIGKGVYIVKIKTGEKTEVKKIIKI